MDSEPEPETEIPACVRPYVNFNRMADVVRRCKECSRHGRNIEFDLPKLGVSDCYGEAMTHVSFVVNEDLIL